MSVDAYGMDADLIERLRSETPDERLQRVSFIRDIMFSVRIGKLCSEDAYLTGVERLNACLLRSYRDD